MRKEIGRSNWTGVRALLLTILTFTPAIAAETAPPMISFQGVAVGGDERSLKCDVKLPAVFSAKRLLDCNSGQLVNLRGFNTTILRFEIEPGTARISEGWRAELRDMYVARNGEEVWYRFATLLPKDFPFDQSNRVVTAQWHELMPLGAQHKRPPLAHRVVGQSFLVTLWNTALYDLSNGAGDGEVVSQDATIEADVIHEYAYRILWNPDSTGRVFGWRRVNRCSPITFTCSKGNWSAFIQKQGPVGYQDAEGYYFKFGVYTTYAFDRPIVAYHRGYHRGPTALSVGLKGAIFSSVGQ